MTGDMWLELLHSFPSAKISAVISLNNLPVCFALLIILLATGGCGGQRQDKNVCPIDGQPPEWSKKRDSQACEYFHWSYTERHTHSWTAPCEQK